MINENLLIKEAQSGETPLDLSQWNLAEIELAENSCSLIEFT